MKTRHWIATGAVLAGLSVTLGALAAHGLEGRLAVLYAGQPERDVAGFKVAASWKYLQDFITAARYQMYHALGLILLGLLGRDPLPRRMQAAGWCFLGGIALFSGSLYVLVLTAQKWLGMVAPLGGTLMIAGWVLLAVEMLRSGRPGAEPS